MESLYKGSPPPSHAHQEISWTTILKTHRRATSMTTPPHPIVSPSTHRRSQSDHIRVDSSSDDGDKEAFLGGYPDALTPINVSFRGRDGSLLQRNASNKQDEIARHYLNSTFGVVDFYICEPWLILGCSPSVPHGRLPQSVGGLIAIWRGHDNMGFMPLIGQGGGIDEETEVDPSILDGFEYGHIPDDDAILRLVTHLFHDCEAVTWATNMLIIELPYSDEAAYFRRLQEMPRRIEMAPFTLRYYNGPLPNTPRARAKRAVRPKPEPEAEERVADGTDYIEKDGRLYPGSMISSQADGSVVSSTCAGVLVQKGAAVRLTCPWHLWEKHDEQYPGLLGQDNDEARRVFGAVQGDEGTYVGHVVQRLGKTDIALMELAPGIEFENSFMGIKATARKFVHSKLVELYDEFLIDSFTTGQQRLLSIGRRFVVTRGPGQPDPHLVAPNGDNSVLPPVGVAYISAQQGLCGTTEPVLTSKPYIRDSAYGSVLLRSQSKTPRTDTEALEQGEIVAMFHFADLTAKYATEASSYIIYADAVDPLIDDGWTIVPVKGEVQPNLIPAPIAEEAEEAEQEGPVSKRLRTR
ncbi:hypothetical protein QBC39DRAFT_325971 [Podospora conica]|nr:hypothetical protein QBC39DRAFT_325971 [Schizothecium conicum]